MTTRKDLSGGVGRKPNIPPGSHNRKKFRPNFRRQMLYAGVVFASILAGYFVIGQFAPKQTVSDTRMTSPQPWYQKQSPPPSQITIPDAPLFPEHDESQTATDKISSAQNKLAYEEALPPEIYEPQPQAMETTETALLPMPRKSDATVSKPPPWRRYAVAFTAQDDRPLIAIVIDDMGVDQKRSARAMKLRAPLTLSFLTYADDLARQTSQARANGHELMLHIPMEPTSHTVDPGPNVLLTGLDDDELRRRLDWGFSRFTGYVGINNHMGSKFTADSRAMKFVMEAVKRRGLLFLDSRTSAHTVGAKMARQMGVPMTERNIFIDHVNNIDDVHARLAEVEKMARRNGYAVAIGHPRQVTIEALEVWIKGLRSKGFRLAPISAIVEKYGTS